MGETRESTPAEAYRTTVQVRDPTQDSPNSQACRASARPPGYLQTSAILVANSNTARACIHCPRLPATFNGGQLQQSYEETVRLHQKSHNCELTDSSLQSENRHSQSANMVLGRLTHYAFDAVLFSAFLAGMKRSTGLTPSFKKDPITENKDINVWIDKYLGVGEWVMDQSVAIAGSSGWFERKR